VLRVGSYIEHEEDMSEYARRAMHSGELTLIDLHRHLDKELPVGLGFMGPLSLSGASVGAIYFSEDPARYLFPLIESWPTSSLSGETQLVRAEGDQVMFLNKLRHRPDAPLTLSFPLNSPGLAAAEAVLGKQGLLEHAHDYSGAEVLSFAMPIAGTPWVLVSKVSEAEAYGLVNRIERIVLLMVAIIFVIGGAWFWQWWRREQFAQRTAILEQQLKADEALLEKETRYHTLFDNAAVPILEEDFSEIKARFLELKAAGVENFRDYFLAHPEEVRKCAAMVKIIAINKPGLEFFRVSSRKELVQHLPSFFIEESWVSFTNELIALADGAMYFEHEVPMRSGAGECRDLLLKLSIAEPSREKLDHVLISFIDITERKQSESRVNFLAYHDRLTGLPNRALFFDRLSQAMSQARRSHNHVALLYLDLDGFKPVNDMHGHEAGDAVLKMVAQRLLACVRAVDTVARLGGDEFAIVAGELDSPVEVERIAEHVLQAFAQTMALPDGEVCMVGCSIGISIYPDNGDEMDSLLAAADAAMYDSKRNGKNTYSYFGGEPAAVDDAEAWIVFDKAHHVGVVEIDEQHRELVRLVNRLNGAIKNKEGDSAIMELYDELLKFTAFHFATEHRLMEQSGYPDMAKHDLEHNSLVDEAMHFKSRLSVGGELLALQSIKDWLLNHIHYSDKTLANYLQEHRVR
jgi:diguanylate cyclase (GGDEF)-like protein/hemerythrin-like metal-binding protein